MAALINPEEKLLSMPSQGDKKTKTKTSFFFQGEIQTKNVAFKHGAKT